LVPLVRATDGSTLARWPVFVLAIVVAVLAWSASNFYSHRPFPSDRSPEGAYARIALAIAQRKPQEAFAYLETEAQWASYTILQARREACRLVVGSYPSEEAKPLLSDWTDIANAPDGSDVFALMAARRGWIARLERDLSGAARVLVEGDRATVVTARGTRYAFRRRDNGIWGLTIFTPELEAEAEKASRDLQVVERAAADYRRAQAR
jgi:hypothetical protein